MTNNKILGLLASKPKHVHIATSANGRFPDEPRLVWQCQILVIRRDLHYRLSHSCCRTLRSKYNVTYKTDFISVVDVFFCGRIITTIIYAD